VKQSGLLFLIVFRFMNGRGKVSIVSAEEGGCNNSYSPKRTSENSLCPRRKRI